MRSARAIGFGLAFLFAGVMARAQQTPPGAKLTPTTPAVNKTTCEKSVAKIGTPAPSVTKADRFARMDVNKDGKIGPTEFKGPKKAFGWVDTDHDGYITRPEATRAYLTVVGEMAIAQRVKAFKSMDENKDGKISLSEYRGPTRAFARVDVNHDGVITAEEAKNAFQASVGRFVIATRFRTLDANHDGMISAAEFKGPKAAFAKYDRDKWQDRSGRVRQDDPGARRRQDGRDGQARPNRRQAGGRGDGQARPHPGQARGGGDEDECRQGGQGNADCQIGQADRERHRAQQDNGDGHEQGC